MATLRVLVVAADLLTRAGLAALLSQQEGIQIVGQVADNEDLTAALTAYRPEVLIWDMGWQTPEALERLADGREEMPPVVALLPDEGVAMQAWQAGARGLLARDTDAAGLRAALLSVAQGLAVLSPSLARAISNAREAPPPPLIEPLTPRESEVLQLLAEGLPNKNIAQRLNVSEHTVKFHINAILGKLGAQSRTEAAIRAARLGLIHL